MIITIRSSFDPFRIASYLLSSYTLLLPLNPPAQNHTNHSRPSGFLLHIYAYPANPPRFRNQETESWIPIILISPVVYLPFSSHTHPLYNHFKHPHSRFRPDFSPPFLPPSLDKQPSNGVEYRFSLAGKGALSLQGGHQLDERHGSHHCP